MVLANKLSDWLLNSKAGINMKSSINDQSTDLKQANHVDHHGQGSKDDVMTRAFLTALYNMNRVNSFQEGGKPNHQNASSASFGNTINLTSESNTSAPLLASLQKNPSLSFDPYYDQIQNNGSIVGNSSHPKEPLELLMEQLKEANDTIMNVNNAENDLEVGTDTNTMVGSHRLPGNTLGSQKNLLYLQQNLDLIPNYEKSKGSNQLSNVSMNSLNELHHSQQPTPAHICSVCDREFLTPHLLKSHSITHENIKPFQCPSCSQKFSRKHDLTRHLKTHSQQKPFVCEKCGRRFSRKDALKRHNNMKSNQKTHCTTPAETLPVFTPEIPHLSAPSSHFQPSNQQFTDQFSILNEKSHSKSFDINGEEMDKSMNFPLGDYLSGSLQDQNHSDNNALNFTSQMLFQKNYTPSQTFSFEDSSVQNVVTDGTNSSQKVSFRPPTTEDLSGYMTHSQAVEAVASSIVQHAFSRSA